MLSIDDSETYELLLDICSSFDIDPQASIEIEAYFRDMLSEIPKGTEDRRIREKVSLRLKDDFVALGKPPAWIQGSEWPFQGDKPMLFVGQIDISAGSSDLASDYFHDDASVYVFLGKKGPAKVIVQQY